jgi:outer membrane autotransporter protein
MGGFQHAAADLFEAGNNYNSYGHLNQDDVPVIGDMACCPTSAINSLTYLQNRFPVVYGSQLVSIRPIDEVQGIAGRNYMNTGAETGTTTALGIWGRYLYVESRVPLQTQYSCQIATINGQPLYGAELDPTPWPANRPLPRYMENAPPSVLGGASVPTWQFVYQNLQRGADIGIGITYIENGRGNSGHCLTVHHFSFNDATKSGTISFVDPADQTERTYNVWQNSDNSFLNGYPYLTLDYGNKRAIIDYIIVEYPTPQTVTNTVETGSILVLGTNAPYETLTFRGGILYAADSQMTWNKAMILETAGQTIFDSATHQLTLTGAISGQGGLNKMGTGILYLRGTNSYSGGTTLTEGTINIVQDSNLGNPAGSLNLKGGTLQAGADLSSSRAIVALDVPGTQLGVPGTSGLDTGVYHSTLSGTVTGTGSVMQTGRGSLTLSGNSSSYAGEYTLASGTLILQGTLGDELNSMMAIQSNGTLKGMGTLAMRLITNHGTVSPGNSVGTLTMTGGFDQQTDGRLEVEVASATSYDRLRLTGNNGSAAMRGTVKPILVDGYRPPANTVFSGIVTTERSPGIYSPEATIENNTPIRTWQVLFSDDHVDLTLTRNYAHPSLGLNANQQAVGTMLNGVADTTSGDLATVLNALDDLPTGNTVADAYQQISPDKASALPALSLAGSMMQWRTLSSRLTHQRWSRGSYLPLDGDDFGSFDLSYSSSGMGGLRLAYNSSDLGGLVRGVSPEPADRGRWGIFTEFVGTSGSLNSSTSQTGYNFNILGFIGGADYRLREDLLLGVGAGYYHTSTTYDDSGGSAGVNSIPIFAYTAYTPGDFYAIGFLGFTLNLYDLNRNVTFDGVSRTATSSVDGSQFNAALEAGYDLRFTKAIVTPVATLFYSKACVGGFTETGAGSLNLNVDSQSADSLQSGIGVRVSRPFKTGKTEVLPQIFAFYQHEFANDSRGLNARLAQAGSTFVFQTDSPGRDFAVLGAGLSLNFGKNLSFQASYNAELGRGNYTAQFLSAGLRWEF